MNVCHKCGKQLAPGEIRYRLKIEITSMFDGHINEPEGDIDQEIAKTLAELERMSQPRIERDVAEGVALVICLDCRNALTGRKMRRRLAQALLED